MKYLELLKQQNIVFKDISEEDAETIMKSQYSYYKLMDFSVLFDRYVSTEKRGSFVNLDFSQLYYLALIDTKLSQIMMCLCLDIERCIKSKLLDEVDHIPGTHMLLSSYYNSDKEYIDKIYTKENIDALEYSFYEKDFDNMQLNQFLDIAQFGTIERLVHYYCKNFSLSNQESNIIKYEPLLYSVRRIRNIVAHNNSILSKLPVACDYKNLNIRSILGKKGINNRTLTTNMSKAIICDIVNVLYLYFEIVPNYGDALEMFRLFDNNFVQKYSESFNNNYQIKSVYRFMCSVISLFSKDKKGY